MRIAGWDIPIVVDPTVPPDSFRIVPTPTCALRLSEGFCPLPGHPALTRVPHGAAEDALCRVCSPPDVRVQWFTSHGSAYLACIGHGLNWGTCFDLEPRPDSVRVFHEDVVRYAIAGGIVACRGHGSPAQWGIRSRHDGMGTDGGR